MPLSRIPLGCLVVNGGREAMELGARVRVGDDHGVRREDGAGA